MKIVEYIPVFLLMLILPVYVVRSRCGGVMCAPKAEIPKIKWIKTPEIANPEDRETPEEAAPLPAEPESTENGAESDENTPEAAKQGAKKNDNKGAAETKDDDEN